MNTLITYIDLLTQKANTVINKDNETLSTKFTDPLLSLLDLEDLSNVVDTCLTRFRGVDGDFRTWGREQVDNLEIMTRLYNMVGQIVAAIMIKTN